MTREEAINIVRKNYPHVGVSGSQFETALRNLIPELRESEDERIRRELIEYLKGDLDDITTDDTDRWINWIEKQKELPFVKDVMLGYPGLYFYDGERMHFRGPAMEEKQKEPKELPLMGGNADLYFDEWNQQKQNPTKRQCFEEGMRYAQRLQKEQKPVEWSEEDEKLLDLWLDVIDRNDWRMDENFCKASREFINKLKSIRPKPHWKPKWQQVACLRYMINASTVSKIDKQIVRDLYEQLKKLM